VRVRTLGYFQVQIDDKPLGGRGKAQRKPLELLKAILAQRNSADVGSVLDLVWPDLDGDAARNAFDLTVHRLRKLMHHKDAIVLSQGRVLLHPELVWVDSIAFEKLLAKAACADDAAEHCRRMFRLYQGPFLADEDAPWMIATRNRLHSQFVRSVREVCQILHKPAQWQTRVNLLQAALEVDPHQEIFYHDLIQSLLTLGREAEAVDAYRRCEEVMMRSLGVKPSPATRALLPNPPKL
jgi:DNA-binding SARP family transcriptional activator